MKRTALIMMLAASTFAASAQTPATKSAAPVTVASKPANSVSAVKPAATAAKPATAESPLIAAKITTPANIKPVIKGPQKTIFTAALRYQEIKIGDGPEAEPGKLYKVLYTGYRASDGAIFDASDLHRMPMKDKDGKPVLGEDGKPKLDDPQPMPFPQGKGGTIIGFDQGFVGMKVHGKRRIFIPWQLAYGTREIPDHGPEHPGIPAKSDLIFDVELVAVTEMPPPQTRPGMPMGARPMPPNGRPMPPRPGTPGAPGSPMPMMNAPKPPVPPAPGTAPNAVAPTPSTPPAPPTASSTSPATPQPK